MTRLHYAFCCLIAVMACIHASKANAFTVHATEGEAYAACAAQFGTEGQEHGGGQVRYENFRCDRRYFPDQYVCQYTATRTSDGAQLSNPLCSGGYSSYPAPSPGVDPYHRWTTPHQCTAGETYEVVSNSPEPANWCDGGCIFEATTGSYDSETGLGIFIAENTGAVCPFDDPGLDEPELPQNCVRNEATGAIACDCSVTPEAAYCQVPPSNPPNDVPPNCIFSNGVYTCGPLPDSDPDLPSEGPGSDPNPIDDTSDTGDNADTGDGDPDTPGDGVGGDPDDSVGTGDGDSDNDGDRDVDCNPLSNPDCPFATSASSTGSCDSPPSCSGDPVACSILRQEWTAMCYPFTDNGSSIPAEYLEGLNGIQLGDFFEGNTQEIDMSSTQLDESGWLGAGACPAPETVTLPFPLGTFSVDYTPFCSVAEWLSYLVMFMAYFAAFRIFFGGLFS